MISDWYKTSDNYYVNDNYNNIFIRRLEYGEYHAYNTGWFVYTEINGQKHTVSFKKEPNGYYKASINGPKSKFTSLKQAIDVVESSDLSDVYTTRYIRSKQIYDIFYSLCDELPGCASTLANYFNNDEVVLEIDDMDTLEEYIVDTLIDKYNNGEMDSYAGGMVEDYLLN